MLVPDVAVIPEVGNEAAVFYIVCMAGAQLGSGISSNWAEKRLAAAEGKRMMRFNSTITCEKASPYIVFLGSLL